MKNKLKILALTAAAFATLGTTAHAQSADALIDKLVDKGILTTKEAQDLRDEADKNFATAFASKTGMADWVTALKFNGDLRLRYDGIYGENPAYVERHRFRYRLRFGFTVDLMNDFEVGLKLTSSEGSGGGDPISGNTTFTGNGSKKLIYIDLAYAKWSPIHTPDWAGSFTFGKMENPFVFPSTMMFDKDYTPEGIAAQLAYNINDVHTMRLNAGAFALYEASGTSSDAYFGGAQLRWDAKWNATWSSTAGAAAFGLMSDRSLASANVPDGGRGNTRATINGVANTLRYQYRPVYFDGGITHTLESFPMYPGAFPISLSGDFVHNSGAPRDNEGYSIGMQFGKAGKKGTWQLDYRWEALQADAWYEEFVESDFGSISGTSYGSGTNIKGHWFKFSYSPYDSLTLGLSCFMTKAINNPVNSGATRIMADAVWKF